MITTYAVEVTDLPSQPVAVVRERVDLAGLPAFLSHAFGEVMRVCGEQQLPPCGPPFARYSVTPEGFDVTAGFPIRAPVRPDGHVVADTLPGGLAAQVMHRGAYGAVASAYEAATDWMQEHGYAPAGDAWESYLDGPATPEPRTLVTLPCHAA